MPPNRSITPSTPRKMITLPSTPPSTPQTREPSIVMSREVIRVKSEYPSPVPPIKREPSEVPLTPVRRGTMGPPPTPISTVRKRLSASSRRSISTVPYPDELRRRQDTGFHFHDNPFRPSSRARSEISLASEAESFFSMPQRSTARQNRPRQPRQGESSGDGTGRVTPSTVSLPAGISLVMKQAKDVLCGWQVKERDLEDEELVMLEASEQILCETLFDVAQFGTQAFRTILDRSEIDIRPAQLSMILNFLTLKVPAALGATLSDYHNLPAGSTKSKDRAVRAGLWREAVRGGMKMDSGAIKVSMTRKTVESVIRTLYIFWAGESGHERYQILKTRFQDISYSDYLDAAGIVRDLCAEIIAEAWA